MKNLIKSINWKHPWTIIEVVLNLLMCILAFVACGIVGGITITIIAVTLFFTLHKAYPSNEL